MTKDFNNKKIKTAVIILLVLMAGFLAARFIFGGPEDSWICVDGAWVKHGNPSAPEPEKPCSGGSINSEEAVPEANVVIDSPVADAATGRAFFIKGRARVFENQLNWAVLNADTSAEIVSGTAYANAPDIGQFGPFEASVILPDSLPSGKIIVQAFDYSAKDGAKIDVAEVLVNFDKSLKNYYEAYFGNTNLDPEASCIKVFPLPRPAEPGELTIQGAIEALLGGVNENEKSAEYYTSIPDGVKLNYVKKSGNAVTLDFSKDIEKNSGGSCRAAAIRSQIYWTVINLDKTVRTVIPSVEGEIETALQP